MKDREYEYLVTMSMARHLLESGVITREEYGAYNTKMLEKYQPESGDLFTSADLL